MDRHEEKSDLAGEAENTDEVVDGTAPKDDPKKKQVQFDLSHRGPGATYNLETAFIDVSEAAGPCKVMDGNTIVSGCKFAFDIDSKCMTVACKDCTGAMSSKKGNRCPAKCPCGKNKWQVKDAIKWIGKRSKAGDGMDHHFAGTAKVVAKRIVDDWEKGEINPKDPEFKDLLFCLPVSCMMCDNFLSEEVKECVEKEVERDKQRKAKKNPKWKARDWQTLRQVVHANWEM